MAGKAKVNTNYDPKVLGSNIVEKRKELKITRQKLTADAGISYQAMCNIESGTANPKLDTIVSIAGALGMTIEELMKGAIL